MTTIANLSIPLPREPVLPDGRAVGSVEQGALYREFARLGVPGFQHSLGRVDAINKYGDFLQRVYDRAGQKALADFMAQNRSV